MIGVVCAHNPGQRNLGMYSVDLAAQAFFAGSGRSFELIKFTGHTRIGRLRYRLVGSAADLDRYETIVFWGDFQQNPLWGRRNFGPRHARTHRTTLPEGIQRWKELCLMLGRIRPPGQRWYSVGTCFLGALEALDDAASIAEYASLLAGFEAIVPRDPDSVAELQACAMTNIIPGFDCATILDPGAAPPAGDACFGYAFGRTLSEREGRAVARRIERLTGHRAVPIRWLLLQHRPRWCDYRYSRALQVIRETRYVVTDIYHLAVTTLNAGRDVLCIGAEGREFQDTCHDLKKAVLFRMADLSNRYLEIPVGTADRVEYVARHFSEPRRGSGGHGATFLRLRADCRSRLRQLFVDGGVPVRDGASRGEVP